MLGAWAVRNGNGCCGFDFLASLARARIKLQWYSLLVSLVCYFDVRFQPVVSDGLMLISYCVVFLLVRFNPVVFLRLMLIFLLVRFLLVVFTGCFLRVGVPINRSL